MRRHGNMGNLATAVSQDSEAEQELEADCWNDEKVDRRNAIRMVLQKGLPRLRRWMSTFLHVFRDSRSCDIDTELQQLALDAGCAP